MQFTDDSRCNLALRVALNEIEKRDARNAHCHCESRSDAAFGQCDKYFALALQGLSAKYETLALAKVNINCKQSH